MMHKPWIENTLKQLDFVQWDRYYDFGPNLAFYGWINRDDYKDFLVVILDNENRLIRGFHTSSAEHAEEIADILGLNHSPCRRVEDKLEIGNVVQLNGGENTE